MRKNSRGLLIAAMLIMQAALLMSPGYVTSAHAVGLAGFSPNPFLVNGVSAGGLPAWYQDQNGVTVQPCLDVAACALVGAPDFNPNLPVAYPTNFPSEAFYFNATTTVTMTGGASALVVMAMEYTFVNPITGALTSPAATPTALAAPFQRLRLVETVPGGAGVLPPAAANGNFTVTTPWGVTVFAGPDGKCVNSGGDTKCSFTRDLLPAAVPVNPAGALGAGIVAPDSAISTFLRDPIAPAGFLGSGAAAASFTGAPAGHLNSVSVSDPLGNSGTTAQLTTLVGKTIGMDVQPGVNNDFGAVNMVTPPAVLSKKTISVTNTTGNAVTFAADLNAAAVKTGADALDFVVGPPTQPAAPAPALTDCAGAAVLAAGSGGFDITFTPVAAAKGPRVASILLAPTAALPANNPPPVTLSLKGAAQVTIATTVATPHGTITPDATVDPVTGGAPAGSPVGFKVVPSNNKFKIKDVSEGAALLTPSLADPTLFTINTAAVNHTVTANFMPSGDLDADGTLGVNDALKALRIVIGIQQADVDDPDNSAVKVAPLTGGVPPAINSKATPDIGDVLVILRRVLNLDVW